MRASAMDETGTILHDAAMSSSQLGDPVEGLTRLIAETQNTVGGLAAVVLGIPGILDIGRRTILSAALVPSLEIENFADILETACGVPVLLDHDVTLQLRGEIECGAANGHARVLGIYFGTGVGAAFLDHGALCGGPYRMQIGHVPMRGDGRIGTGGALDCIEAYASGRVLERIAAQHETSLWRLFDEKAKPELATTLDRFVHDQALTVATALTLTDPEVVVLGGGVLDTPAYPLDQLVAQVRTYTSPVVGRDTRPIVRARLGTRASAWGALALVRSMSGSEAGNKTSQSSVKKTELNDV